MNAFWTVRQTAEHLGLTTKTVYRLIEQGDLEAARLGPRSMRVARDSVERLVRDRNPVVMDELEEVELDFSRARARRESGR